MSYRMNYTTLQEDVRNYLERGQSLAADPTVFEQIPRLINLAERRIALELKIEGFINVVSTVLQLGVSVYDKPDRWRDTISFTIGTDVGNNTRKVLFTRSYEYIRAYWPNSSTTDEPVFYGDYDYHHWVLAPTPDADYTAEILFYEIPALLSDDNQTNWITDHIPQLLLYASLLEAAPFLKNDERIGTWQSMYDRSAAMVNGEDLSRMLDRTAVRKEA